MGDETPIRFLPADLAAGDAKSLKLDYAELSIASIRSVGDPLFETAYNKLWAEFGAAHEMESREVIARRLGWQPATCLNSYWLRYELLLVTKGEQFVAVRDHTAIVNAKKPSAVVHLSHVLIDPAWRRTGLAGWLRALPIQTARACLTAANCSSDAPITLAAEMEHPQSQFPSRMIRLTAYQKAGYQKVDPSLISYHQPDFRSPEAIDTGGGPHPLPFAIILRRVGREQEKAIRAGEAREIVECLYTMYGTGFRTSDMAAVWKQLESYPASETSVPLVPPTQ